jgi:hypothetical protein
MTTPQAILTGFALVAAAVALHGVANTQTTPEPAGGYDITSAAVGRALIVMRINRSTGAVSLCDGEGSASLPRCTAWVR